MIDPFSLKSLLLAPTEIPVAPDAICHCCDTTSQTEKSSRESVSETSVDSPGVRKMLSKPLRLNGADRAEAGGEVYSCGTLSRSTRHVKSASLGRNGGCGIY